jgi:endonuclease/exonuclease/phosphatase family metal-dependent hydrolase
MSRRGPAALSGLLLLLAVQAGPDVTAEPARPLRVVSYNILHGGALSGLNGKDEDLEARLRISVEELRALDPDVIGLQEASTSRRRGNVARRLARELGYPHHAYAPTLFRFFSLEFINRHVSWLFNFTEGPAIVSRFPIVGWEFYGLPRCNGYFDPRVLLHVTVRTPWGDMGVASTHTSRGFCQADRVVELMEERRGVFASVLMGDFNAVEDSTGILRLTHQAGYVDAFRAANPGDPGATVFQPVRAPVPMARRRVDFVFLLPGHVVPGRVLSSRVVLNTPGTLANGEVLWPSDHYGVLAELDVFPAFGGTP